MTAIKNFFYVAAVSGMLIYVAPVVKAQDRYVPHVSVGARGGVTLSNISFSPSIEQSMLMGYTFGGVFTYAEERHVGLRVELSVTSKGWKEDFEELKDEFNYNRRLTYIELPVMTHIFFGGKNVKCLFNLGSQFGYMISDNVSANFDYMHPDQVPGFPMTNRQYEQLYTAVKTRFDYGIVGGVGAEFIVNKKNSIQVEARYYFGLGNIYPSSKKDTFAASRNQTISVAFAYMFRLK